MMFSRKTSAALSAGLLFFVISSPFAYKMVDQILTGIFGSILPNVAYWFRIAEAGCPTTTGLVVHSVVFALVAYAMMSRD
jgi:hypothetical protein